MEQEFIIFKITEKSCLNSWVTALKKAPKIKLKSHRAIIREPLLQIHKKVYFQSNYLNNPQVNIIQIKTIQGTDQIIKLILPLILKNLPMELSEKHLRKMKLTIAENIFLERLKMLSIKMNFNQFQLKNLTA